MLLQTKRRIHDFLGDAACVVSLLGIWPRFIEPRLLATTHLSLSLPRLPPALEGLKILHFSDLHLHPKVSDSFLNKLTRKINGFQPDVIVATGDFLCCSVIKEPERLIRFLSSLKAQFGCFAVLGNHDYAEFVSLNDGGDYDVIKETSSTFVKHGFNRLVQAITPTGKVTARAKNVGFHTEFMKLIQRTPLRVLHNDTVTIPIKDAFLNIVGLGEHTLGQSDPEKAFREYNRSYPGIVLAHNPDVTPHLQGYPGEILLCGHTHGAEIYLPWLWRKFTIVENPDLKRGLKRRGDRWIYTNRGVGGSAPFRLFSMPELLLLTLRSHDGAP